MGVIMILLVVGIFVLGTSLHRNLAVLDASVVVTLILMTVESLLTIKVGLLHAEETEDGDESAETRVEELHSFLWLVLRFKWDDTEDWRLASTAFHPIPLKMNPPIRGARVAPTYKKNT